MTTDQRCPEIGGVCQVRGAHTVHEFSSRRALEDLMKHTDLTLGYPRCPVGKCACKRGHDGPHMHLVEGAS